MDNLFTYLDSEQRIYSQYHLNVLLLLMLLILKQHAVMLWQVCAIIVIYFQFETKYNINICVNNTIIGDTQSHKPAILSTSGAITSAIILTTAHTCANTSVSSNTFDAKRPINSCDI